jgi:NAD(P)H-flavin reductase/hemoglobin-like flavoprotein
MDAQRLKDSFAKVAVHGDEVPLFFYSDLFLRHPETREFFPVAMDAQRDRLVQALMQIVSNVDNLSELAPFIQGLGRDHRKFGAVAEHYNAVGASLLAALAHFSGPDWTPGLEAEWQDAYGLVAKVMIEAAQADESLHPAWWDATVINHELRSFDIAVFRVTTHQRLPYAPGQSVAIESADVPRIWRFYSMANAPREDSTLDFHIQMTDGGALSSVLARGLRVGSRLRLGQAVGGFTLDKLPERDILLVAGGTGLAPVKAIAEQVAELPDPPRVHLFFGARRAEGLYDLPDLEKMAAQRPWFTVVSAVSDEPDYPGERGLISDVVTRSGSWDRHEVYVAGPTAMVEATVGKLTSARVPAEQIHVEDFGWSTS